MKLYKLYSILGALTVLLLVSTGIAEAGKTDWRDPNYNFKAVQSAWIEDIDLSAVKLDSDIQEKGLQQYYREQVNRPKWQVLTTEQIDRKISLQEWKDMTELRVKDPAAAKALWKKDLGNFVSVYVTAALTRYDETSYVIPAHTEWQTREEKDTFKDKDGKEQTITRTYEVPVYVPDRTVWVGNVTVRYDLIDAKTDAVIFSREDVRNDEGDLKDIYELSVRSFFRELKNFEIVTQDTCIEEVLPHIPEVFIFRCQFRLQGIFIYRVHFLPIKIHTCL